MRMKTAFRPARRHPSDGAMTPLLVAGVLVGSGLTVQLLVNDARPPAEQMGSYYFRDCAEARAAFAVPLERGEPWYREDLDRDGDGLACELYRGNRVSYVLAAVGHTLQVWSGRLMR